MIRYQCDNKNPLTRHAPGTAAASGDTVVTGDDTHNDVTDHTQTSSVVRHFDGDVTIKGTLYADNLRYTSTFGTSDPASKFDMSNLSVEEAAALVNQLDVVRFRSKLDPEGRTQWGFNAQQVGQASGGEFVSHNSHSGYDQVDYQSLLAGYCALTKWLFEQHRMQTGGGSSSSGSPVVPGTSCGLEVEWDSSLQTCLCVEV